MAAARGRLVLPLRVGVPAAVLSALLVAVLGLRGSPAAVPVGAVLAGLLPLVAAVAVWQPGRQVPTHQRLFAAAIAAAGVGQLVRAAALLGRAPGLDTPFPTAGDVVALASAPLAVAGLVVLARAVPGLTGVGLPAVRLLLDAMLLALSLALLLWRSAYGRVSGAVAVLVVLVVLADLVVGCMAGLLALRRPGPALLTA